MKRQRGFTLVELMVVVAIIAILLAVLLPALAEARFHARVTQCAANEHQFVGALISYANDNNDSFPRFDAPSALTGNIGAGNPHDMAHEFYNALHGRYSQPTSAFFCPFTDEGIASTPPADGAFMETGYAYWVQRIGDSSVSTLVFPPDPGEPMMINGTQRIGGPSKIGGTSDTLSNPILSDDIYIYPGVAVNSPTFNIAQAPLSDFYYESNHTYRGRIDVTNVGYADGHVEGITPDRLQWRYLSGNAWVIR